MSLDAETNDELRDGIRDRLVILESRSSGFIHRLLQIGHRALDEADRLAHEDGLVTARAGGTEKGP